MTPAQYQYVIDDMFESITLYDNRAVSADAKALADGRYEVTLKVAAKKLRADGLGKETEVPLADWIDIGVLDADGKPLALETPQHRPRYRRLHDRRRRQAGARGHRPAQQADRPQSARQHAAGADPLNPGEDGAVVQRRLARAPAGCQNAPRVQEVAARSSPRASTPASPSHRTDP